MANYQRVSIPEGQSKVLRFSRRTVPEDIDALLNFTATVTGSASATSATLYVETDIQLESTEPLLAQYSMVYDPNENRIILTVIPRVEASSFDLVILIPEEYPVDSEGYAIWCDEYNPQKETWSYPPAVDTDSYPGFWCLQANPSRPISPETPLEIVIPLLWEDTSALEDIPCMIGAQSWDYPDILDEIELYPFKNMEGGVTSFLPRPRLEVAA